MVNKFIVWLMLILILLSTKGYLLLCDDVIDESELEYFAQVVEAESDKSAGCTEGKVYIACCIWDRVNSSYFPIFQIFGKRYGILNIRRINHGNRSRTYKE